MDLTEFVHGSGAHVNEHGETVAGAPTFEENGRLATSWDFGFGPSVEVWVDEIPLLEADAVLYGNVYLVKGSGRVCDRIDPSRITAA
jgi:hypothetical protein